MKNLKLAKIMTLLMTIFVVSGCNEKSSNSNTNGASSQFSSFESKNKIEWTNPNTNDQWITNKDLAGSNLLQIASYCENQQPTGKWTIPTLDELYYALQMGLNPVITDGNDWNNFITTDGDSSRRIYRDGKPVAGIWFFSFSNIFMKFKQNTQPKNVIPVCVQRSSESNNPSIQLDRQLFWTVLANDVQKSKELIKLNANPSFSISYFSTRAVALKAGSPEMIQLFVDSGLLDINQNYSDLDGSTPLNLIAAGPSSYFWDFTPYTNGPIDSIKSLYPQNLTTLLKVQPRFDVLAKKTNNRSTSYINYLFSEKLLDVLGGSEFLFSNGLNPNEPMVLGGLSWEEGCALSYAADYVVTHKNYLNTIQSLLEHGANVNCQGVPENKKSPIEALTTYDQRDNLDANNPSDESLILSWKAAQLLCQYGAMSEKCVGGNNQYMSLNLHIIGADPSSVNVILRMKTTQSKYDQFFYSKGKLESSYGSVFILANLKGRINSTYVVEVSAPGMESQSFEFNSSNDTNHLEIRSVTLKPKGN